MNQTVKSHVSGKGYFIAVLLSFPLAIGVFFALTYLFYQIPKFESYYSIFPWCYYLILSFAVAAMCYSLRFHDLTYSLTVSGILSLVSIIAALLFYTEHIRYPILLGTRGEFLVLTVLFHSLMIKKKSKKPMRKEPFRLQPKR